MFSQSVEYALRAAVVQADHPGATATTEQVAGRAGVPAAYLAKLLQSLTRAGLVRSQRGVGGGVGLARDPGSISLLDVVTAIEPVGRVRGRRPGFAGLDDRLDAAVGGIEQALADTTLAELAAGGVATLATAGR